MDRLVWTWGWELVVTMISCGEHKICVTVDTTIMAENKNQKQTNEQREKS